MRLGLRLPQRVGTDLRHDVTEVAGAAERAGFDSVWAWERLLFPVAPRDSFTPGAPWPSAYRQAADPLTVLAAAAVVTERVRLGTSVIVAGLHQPLQLAKRFATLDQISGGRVVAGLGTGWAVDEFEAVGMAKSERGRLLDETLDVFDAAWGPDPVNYRGPHTLIDNAYVLPKPLRRFRSSWPAMSMSAPPEVPMRVCWNGLPDVPTVGCRFSRPRAPPVLRSFARRGT